LEQYKKDPPRIQNKFIAVGYFDEDWKNKNRKKMKEKEEKKDNDAKEDGGKKRRLAEEEYKRLFRKGERPPVT
jgi:hypothetical protein